MFCLTAMSEEEEREGGEKNEGWRERKGEKEKGQKGKKKSRRKKRKWRKRKLAETISSLISSVSLSSIDPPDRESIKHPRSILPKNYIFWPMRLGSRGVCAIDFGCGTACNSGNSVVFSHISWFCTKKSKMQRISSAMAPPPLCCHSCSCQHIAAVIQLKVALADWKKS